MTFRFLVKSSLYIIILLSHDVDGEWSVSPGLSSVSPGGFPGRLENLRDMSGIGLEGTMNLIRSQAAILPEVKPSYSVYTFYKSSNKILVSCDF